MDDNVVKVNRLGNRLVTHVQYQVWEDEIFVGILTAMFRSSVYGGDINKDAAALADLLVKQSTEKERCMFNKTVRLALKSLRQDVKKRT